jgi:hypothetical protein
MAWATSLFLLAAGLAALWYFLQGSPYLPYVLAVYAALGALILMMKVTLIKRLLKTPPPADGPRS